MYKLKENGSILRLEDMVFIPQVEGNRDYNEYLDWIKSGNTPQNDDICKQKLISDAWMAANNFAQQNMDENSRHTISLLTSKMALGQLEEWQIKRINAYWKWWETLWNHYESVKSNIINDIPSTFDGQCVGNCPFTIWQLIENT